MLKSNLWLEKDLVNEAMVAVVEICYEEDAKPLALPQFVNVRLYDYSGPTFGLLRTCRPPPQKKDHLKKVVMNGVECSE